MMNKILFYNPRSAVAKHRIPNSIMNIAASVNGKYDWVIVDGNREEHPYGRIQSYLATGEFKYIGFTVMPGPQTKQSIPFSKKIKEEFPGTILFWGEIFPAKYLKGVLNSGFFFFFYNGPGDSSFPKING